jgi:hypothetical protein
MMGRVIFFPLKYLPGEEEIKRLQSWQDNWDLWLAKLKYDQKQANLSAFQIAISNQRYHHGVRDSWKVYPGFKGQWQPQPELSASL